MLLPLIALGSIGLAAALYAHSLTSARGRDDEHQVIEFPAQKRSGRKPRGMETNPSPMTGDANNVIYLSSVKIAKRS